MSSGRSLPASTIAHMLAEYRENPSCRHVSKVCNVSRATVKRYVELGDPLRGIMPFQVILATQTIEETVEYSEDEAQKVAKDHIRRLDRVIDLMAKRAETELANPKKKISIRGTDLAKAMQIRMQLVSVYKPWKLTRTTTTTMEISGEAGGSFDGRSHLELYFFEEQGRWPEHDELAELEKLEDAKANVLPPQAPSEQQWPKEIDDSEDPE